MADPALAPRDIIGAGLCIGCGACAAGEGKAMGWDRYGQLKPAGAWTGARDAGFAQICPFSPTAVDEDAIAACRFPDPANRDVRIGRYEAAFVGHVGEQGFRARGSSGGLTSWVAAELLRTGLVDGVAHVAPAEVTCEGRFFTYRISRSEAALHAGARSRYYPVELSDVLAEIRATPGRYAIVGIPCFIKAVQLLRRSDPVLGERIAYTLGLFCGHSKSARFVESFAWQLGVPIEQVRAVEYRSKDETRPASWYRAELTLADGRRHARDWWHLADGDWGAGFFQNSACDYCDDVVAETADISFGDAWVEPYSSDGRGTNVVVVRSKQLVEVVRAGIEAGRLDLAPVDREFVVATQAAGLRHRREGLAYRLRIAPPRPCPRKRVRPNAAALPMRRKLVYRSRRAIARWSHRLMFVSRGCGVPQLYVRWAALSLRLYRLLAYGRGR